MAVAALHPDITLLVNEALNIKKRGLAEYTHEAIGDLDAWYVGAYDLVDDAAARAQEEAELLSKQMHEMAMMREAARRQQRGLAS